MAEVPLRSKTRDPFVRVQETIWLEFGHLLSEINESTTLRGDLGMDELDMVELAMSIEEEFGIDFIPEEVERMWITVGDIVTYVRSMGR